MKSAMTRPPLDISFAVPFTHRLRFTEDILGRDAPVLCQLLEAGSAEPPRVLLCLDTAVVVANPLVAERLPSLLRTHARQVQLVGQPELIPGGEACKNDDMVIEQILSRIHQANLDRRSYIIVVGGGAVLDAVGYAAAIAHRGIRLIRLPSTTLGQTDSGVGVKNAINHFGKKNWIGTFAVPWAVINDLGLLHTLSDRDYRAGFAESVKVFLLKSREWFDRLCQSARHIAQRDLQAAFPIIAQSAEFHLAHITQGGDPFEMLEARPLDFGHWSAHKLEPMSQYRIRHGEAVAIGVATDVMVSALSHGLSEVDAYRVLRCLEDLRLPLTDTLMTEHTDEVCQGLEEFRQHLGGQLTLTMLRGVGDPLNVHQLELGIIREAIARVARFAHREVTPS